MAYVAQQYLRWGEEEIAPGDPVPADEVGRDYAGMLRLGQITEVNEPEVIGDKELLKRLKQAEEDRDAAITRAEAAETALASDDDDELVIPEGVVPGETPGWPVGQFVFPLTDEQRAELADAGISGTLSTEDLTSLLTPPVDGDEPPAPADEDALPEGVTDLGGGWYQVGGEDGPKYHGRQALADALK